MKKLMVAGCSFSAVSKTLPGTAWSEVLADKLGWGLTNLARQGCSNGGVRVQIEEIRRQRPDFAIITPTFWDRMEIPARSAPYDWSQQAGGWDPPLQRHLQNRESKNGYKREDGIDNVNYGNNNYNMICETIFTLAENYHHPYRSGLISKDSQTAVRHYIDAIYDNHWKKQQDEWIIVGGLLEMYLDGINFIVCPALLWPFDPANSALWRQSIPASIPDQYVLLNERESPLSVCGNNPIKGGHDADPGYHSNPQGQVIIADNYYKRITQDHRIS
jgi:hypothetical protein